MPLSYCTACYTTQTAKGDSNGDMRSMLSEYPKWNHKKHHRRRACNLEDETWQSSLHRKVVGELAGTEIGQYGVAMRAFGPRRSCIARVRNSLEGSLSLRRYSNVQRQVSKSSECKTTVATRKAPPSFLKDVVIVLGANCVSHQHIFGGAFRGLTARNQVRTRHSNRILNHIRDKSSQQYCH